VLESLFHGPLHIGVNGQLQAGPFDRLRHTDDVDLTAEAVDDDFLVALGAHQLAVVGLLEARLSDNRAGFHTLVLVA
jgi:hypothetical protein